jgi:hypothetical protein
MRSVHVSRVIAAPPSAVYDYAVEPANLTAWASGLARSAAVVDGDTLRVESPMGEVSVRFVARNALGVLDHDVTLPTGTVVTNPLRVLAHPEGCEIVFTVRQIELTDEEFDRDVAAVEADLARLDRNIVDGIG